MRNILATVILFLFCTPFISFASVHVSEVAWMGSSDNANAEWIELYNDGDEISLELLSELTNLSPYYLLRLFKKEVGSTPHIYLTQRRIKKAKQFLTEGDSLSEVAYKTGFVDQSHFTNRFKTIVGMTPGQYIIQNN